MSDFAPFVAAVLRDKTVTDLQQENKNLRRQLAQLRKVEITGRGGRPVYARAQFDENGGYRRNSNLWEVRFGDDGQLQPCPLSALPGVEVRLGGACKASFETDSAFQGFLDNEDEYSDENGKAARFFFTGSGALWLGFNITGFSEERWRAAVEGPQMYGDTMLEFLAEDVASEPPNDKLIKFKTVSFVSDSISGAIESLSLDKQTEDDSENRR